MGSVEDILQLCRLCLVKDQVNIPIFDESSDIRQTFLKISSCLPVKVTREDNLPKRICDECSYKLDMLYIFRNTSTSSEKQLLTWLDQVGLTATAPHTAVSSVTITKPEIQVKQETFDSTEIRHDEDVDAQDYLMQQPDISYQQNFVAFGESSQTDEGPPPKRVKRAAALRQTVQTAEESDEEDMQAALAITKAEGESDDSDEMDDPDYVEAPSTSADDQPGPSGVGKDPIEAPKILIDDQVYFIQETIIVGVVDDEPPPKRRREFLCEECGLMLKSSTSLSHHKDMVHESTLKPEILCNQCGMFFKTNCFQAHRRCHTYSCDVCPAELMTLEELTDHQQTHTTVKHSCNKCNAIFLLPFDLVIHNQEHESSEKMRCIKCPFVTKNQWTMKDHLRRHAVSFNYVCDICHKRFYRQRQLKAHQEVHAQEKKFACKFCDKKFIAQRYLHVHEKFNHTKEMTGIEVSYQCGECGRHFTFEKSLKRHLSGIHKIGPNWQVSCPVCEKIVSNNYNLKIHMRMHTGEKPLVCETCGSRFATPKTFRKHMISKHGVVVTKNR